MLMILKNMNITNENIAILNSIAYRTIRSTKI